MFGCYLPLPEARCSLYSSISPLRSTSDQRLAHTLRFNLTQKLFQELPANSRLFRRYNAVSEDYWLPPGELSEIDRNAGLDAPENIFRCFGCTEAECQVCVLCCCNPMPHSIPPRNSCHSGLMFIYSRRSKPLDCHYIVVAPILRACGFYVVLQGPKGCAKIPWRLEPGGYLKNILNARVYDIAVGGMTPPFLDCRV